MKTLKLLLVVAAFPPSLMPLSMPGNRLGTKGDYARAYMESSLWRSKEMPQDWGNVVRCTNFYRLNPIGQKEYSL